MNKCIYGIYLDNLAQIWLVHIHYISKVSWNHVTKNVLYVSSHNNMDKVSFLSSFIFFIIWEGSFFSTHERQQLFSEMLKVKRNKYTWIGRDIKEMNGWMHECEYQTAMSN